MAQPFDPCAFPGGKPGEGMEEIKEGPVSVFAKLSDARAYRTTDGRVVVQFPGEDKRFGTPTVFGNDHEAVAGLQHLRQARRAENTVRANVIKAGASKTIDPATTGTVDMHDDPTIGPIMRAYDAANPSGKPGLDDLGNYDTGNHTLGDAAHAVKSGLLKIQEGTLSLGAVEARLRELDAPGNKLADMYKTVTQLENRYRGDTIVRIDKAIVGLTKEEKTGGFRRYIEAGEMPSDPARARQMDAAYQQLRQIADEQYAEGQKYGLEMAQRITDKNYWPHRFDVGGIKDPGMVDYRVRKVIDAGLVPGIEPGTPIDSERVKQAALSQLDQMGFGTTRERLVNSTAKQIAKQAADAGTPLTEEQAISLANKRIDLFVKRASSGRSSHLEHERLDAEGYIEDVRAWSIALQANARRIVQARVWGAKDEVLHQAMGEIQTGNFPQASKDFVRRVYELETGTYSGADKVGTLMKALKMWQAAKLSMSAIWNLSGATNPIWRVGPVQYAKAAGRAIGDIALGDYKEHIRKSGAMPGFNSIFGASEVHTLVHTSLDNISKEGNGFLGGNGTMDVLGKLAEGWLRASTSAFNAVEVYVNRGISVYAGEVHFQTEVKRLMRAPEGTRASNAAKARLRELGFNPDTVRRTVEAGKVDTLEEWKTWAGQRVSNDTQFQANVQSLPEFFNSPLGQFVGQFKTYTVGQMRFVARELTAYQRGDMARTARMLSALVIAYPAIGIALTKARSGLMGETLTSKEMDRALADKTTRGILWAGFLGLTTSGLLGIAADYAITSALGNKYQQSAFFIPPAASTVINATNAAVSGAKGIINNDTNEKRSAARSLLSEMGGFGSMIAKRSGISK